MKTAIDRRFYGEEKEIHISEWDGTRCQDDFFCPECGEAVFPVPGKKASFHHHKRKELSCDLRVDGNGQESFYERVGLPIYLRRNGPHFSLSIGFYPLKECVLEVAKNSKTKVTVHSGSHSHQYLVDFTFSNDYTTLKPLDFVPENQGNYALLFSQGAGELSKYWSDFADGFGKDGGIFASHEQFGKKVRRNDTITTGKTYFLMSRLGAYKEMSGVSSTYLGTIHLQQVSFEIREFIVHSCTEEQFRKIEQYLWNGFKVKLLLQKPEISTIWPPTALSGEIQYTCHYSPIFARITSLQSKPEVYCYTATQCTSLPIKTFETESYSPKWIIQEVGDLLPLSIDRKYMANSYLYSLAMPDVLLEDEIITFNQCPLEHLQDIYQGEQVEISSNVSLKIVITSTFGKIVEHFIQNTEKVEVLLPNHGCGIEIYKNNLLLFHKRVSTPLRNKLSETIIDLVFESRPYLNEKTVPIPRKHNASLQQIRQVPQMHARIKESIMRGEIQPSILKLLERRL